MRYTNCIDPHVHLRGDEYDQDYMQMAHQDAVKSGLCHMIEQPNPKPWLVDEEAIRKRLFRFATIKTPKVTQTIHIGLTNDITQVKEALKLAMEHRYGIRSVKCFFTHSTGNMGVLDEDYQREIWASAANLGYKEIFMGHFEDEKCYIGDFDPHNPVSHSLRQNHVAEFVQVERQFRNAVDAGFRGILYIAHVSSPLTIDFILKHRSKVNFKVIIEMTFHHMFLNWDHYRTQENKVKMNPPLREKKMQEKLLEHLLRGDIDIIGTDHAPHPLEKKQLNNPMSGIPAIGIWPAAIQKLRYLKINEQLLEDLTFNRANEIFGLGLEKKEVEVEYDGSIWDKYGYNAFAGVL